MPNCIIYNYLLYIRIVILSIVPSLSLSICYLTINDCILIELTVFHEKKQLLNSRPREKALVELRKIEPFPPILCPYFTSQKKNDSPQFCENCFRIHTGVFRICHVLTWYYQVMMLDRCLSKKVFYKPCYLSRVLDDELNMVLQFDTTSL